MTCAHHVQVVFSGGKDLIQSISLRSSSTASALSAIVSARYPQTPNPKPQPQPHVITLLFTIEANNIEMVDDISFIPNSI